jgi:hypothetical protein
VGGRTEEKKAVGMRSTETLRREEVRNFGKKLEMGNRGVWGGMFDTRGGHGRESEEGRARSRGTLERILKGGLTAHSRHYQTYS